MTRTSLLGIQKVEAGEDMSDGHCTEQRVFSEMVSSTSFIKMCTEDMLQLSVDQCNV